MTRIRIADSGRGRGTTTSEARSVKTPAYELRMVETHITAVV